MKKHRAEVMVVVILWGIILLLCLLLGGGRWLFQRADNWLVSWKYQMNPPEEAVFVPGEAIAATQTSAPLATEATATLSPEIPLVEPVDALPSVDLPSSVLLQGVTYTHQHGKWNYCAPANMTMALSYWGEVWERDAIAQRLKPFDEDKNVSPQEMVDFVDDHTILQAVLRVGGTAEVVKQLLAAGYPVLVETGVVIRDVSTGVLNWAGHYVLIVGYDDTQQQWITRDSYYSPPEYPLDYPVTYADMENEWRGFNFTFLVVFPADERDAVQQLLGNYADEVWAQQFALERALNERDSLSGVNGFLAAYNAAENRLALGDTQGAAVDFDEAFRRYAELPSDQRPWRTLWYRPAAYEAYYRVGRYQDVISLADTTLSITPKPYIEETWYWRGMAYAALGETNKARSDFEQALKYHADYAPAKDALAKLP